jgi:hypothetical protein
MYVVHVVHIVHVFWPIRIRSGLGNGQFAVGNARIAALRYAISCTET